MFCLIILLGHFDKACKIHYSGIPRNTANCYCKIITLKEPNPLAYRDL